MSTEADLDAYLRLFAPYQEQLRQFQGREGEYGGRFALLFRQVIRRLVEPSPLNQRIPQVFVQVATDYLGKNADSVRHFSYEENRHFFLSDLLDWLQVHERGRLMKATSARSPSGGSL
jgi:hypothetical protein